MSTLKVEVVEVLSVEAHPNADRLEIATVLGWQCVTGKGNYKPGDRAAYLPIGSLLPPDVEAKLFGPDSKIKLDGGRIKTIKIRGAVSQGMLARLDTLELDASLPVGTDLADVLGITKYNPPPPPLTSFGVFKPAAKRDSNPNFHKYTSIENLKNFPKVFEPGEEVVVTEKIHGTNFRAGWVKRVPQGLWQRLMLALGWAEEYEFVFGSHNIQLHKSLLSPESKERNVYAEIVRRYELATYIPKGTVIYGEIYGPSIQKGYHYGLKPGETDLAIFDVQRNGMYLSHDEAELAAIDIMSDMLRDRGVGEGFFRFAPLLYRGPYDLAKIKPLTLGDSTMEPSQKVSEGVVVKPAREQSTAIGRKILKLISDDYLMNKNNTEFH